MFGSNYGIYNSMRTTINLKEAVYFVWEYYATVPPPRFPSVWGEMSEVGNSFVEDCATDGMCMLKIKDKSLI